MNPFTGRMMQRRLTVGVAAMLVLASGPALHAQLLGPSWDSPSRWSTLADAGCAITLSPNPSGLNGDGLKLEYQLKPGSGWVILHTSVAFDVNVFPLTFLIKSSSTDNLEIKLIDADGSVFGRMFGLTGMFSDWTRCTAYIYNTQYWWGGDKAFGSLASVELAVSGTGSGTIFIDEIGTGERNLPPTLSVLGPVLDPDSTLPGIGSAQRRASSMNPEDSLVLEWLKVMQDNSSVDKKLLPSQEGDNTAQTFNNSLAALAFMVKGERERAERILDFYSAATVVNNDDRTLQNFFYRGEARGFYQQVSLSTYHDETNSADRWMGDMAWLLCVYKRYERQYASDRYARITTLLKDLLVSYYKPVGSGGYVQHGWRNGDQYLHEATGHHEGNIDCFAAFRLCDELMLAGKVRTWIDSVLQNATDLPLDLYTWRVLAYGRDYVSLLNVPEYDYRYRRVLDVRGKKVVGFYHGADITSQNIWIDGTGHIACGYLSFGDRERGYFYTNQLDSLLITEATYGHLTHSLPYTANRTGGYQWVDTTRGFSSCAAWYILAKNAVNPFQIPGTGSVVPSPGSPQGFVLYPNFPNPFNPNTEIRYFLPRRSFVSLKVVNALGESIAVLVNGEQEAGAHGAGFDGSQFPSGTYFYTLQAGDFLATKKMVLLR